MITPTESVIMHPIPVIRKAIAHFLYNAAISLLYSETFVTFDFNVLSPLQKLIGSLLSLSYTEIIKNGTAHMKQETKPIILPTITRTSINSNLLIYFKFIIFIDRKTAVLYIGYLTLPAVFKT